MRYLSQIKTFFISLVNPYPTRDWYLALGLAAILALGLSAVSVYFFIGIQAGFIGGSSSAAGETVAPSVSREALLRTLETYETRTVNFNEDNYPIPDTRDPSR